MTKEQKIDLEKGRLNVACAKLAVAKAMRVLRAEKAIVKNIVKLIRETEQ